MEVIKAANNTLILWQKLTKHFPKEAERTTYGKKLTPETH